MQNACHIDASSCFKSRLNAHPIVLVDLMRCLRFKELFFVALISIYIVVQKVAHCSFFRLTTANSPVLFISHKFIHELNCVKIFTDVIVKYNVAAV